MDAEKKPERKWPNYVVLSPYAPKPHVAMDPRTIAPTTPDAVEPPPPEVHRTRLEKLEAAAALATLGLSGGIAAIATTPVAAVVTPAPPHQPVQPPQLKPLVYAAGAQVSDEPFKGPSYVSLGNSPTLPEYDWRVSSSQHPLFIARVPDYPSPSLPVLSLPDDSAEELIRVLAPAFPEDNTPEKQAESRQALRHGMEEMKKGAGEIGKDWAKDVAKDHMTEVVLLVGSTLCAIGRKRNNRMLQWVGVTIRHIVHPFNKEAEPLSVAQNVEHEDSRQLTASAAAQAAACTVEQAEAVMKYLGYRKTEIWLPPAPVR